MAALIHHHSLESFELVTVISTVHAAVREIIRRESRSEKVLEEKAGHLFQGFF